MPADTTTPKIKLPTFAKVMPYLLIIVGVIGLAMAFIIMYEKLQLYNNPSYIPSCDLNPVISCGSVMQSKQSNAFGFSNPIVGLAAWPVVITTGVVLLNGARLKRWYWLGLEAGTVFGIGFVHWLFFQSVFRIHALCPYCMVTWIMTITTFWYVTLYNIQSGNIRVKGKLKTFTNFLVRHHLDILILWLLIIAGFILKHFWYYYGHYL